MKKKDDYLLDTVTNYTGETHYVEEDISIPEEFIKNKSLIRMEMNIIQFPIFSKNTKRKRNEVTTYFFNKNKDTYITVKPSSGELIPGEGEEKIFIALMKLMKEKGMEQTFIVTAKEIKEAAKISTDHYIKEIKKSLLRLSETNYNFKNTLYSNEFGKIIESEVSTPILMFKLITLNSDENIEYRKKIDDFRIKEIYQITISEHFYKNLIKRGYLTYDSDILLDINSSIARSLYMLLEKIRFDSLYAKESVYALIKKIPLKYEKSHLPKTIKTLEKALNELKEKRLLKDFNFIKDTTWEKSDLEVFYDEIHNTLKSDRFKKDSTEVYNIYQKLEISHTQKNIDDLVDNNKISEENIEELYNLLPTIAKKLKSMEKTLKTSLEKYGYEKVKKAVIYLKNQKNLKSPRGYFINILENNWAKDIEIPLDEIKKSEREIPKEIYKIENNNELEEKEKQEFLEIFKKLSKEEQEKIEGETFDEYKKSSEGIDLKLQKIAFKNAKNSLIAKYIKKNKINLKETITSTTENDIMIGINEVQTIIESAITLANMIENYSPERKKEILSNILGELIPLLTSEGIGKTKLNEAIKKYIKY